jgi:uncharacterized protein YjbI with pentapeptide repeats
MSPSFSDASHLRHLVRHPGFWGPAAALAAVGLLVLLLGPVAWWATPAKHLQGKDKADARNATRQVVLAAAGGLVLLTGAGFTARTFYLARRGQLTDRYTKAIGQLASDKVTERLGGVYALEHLLVESERDHSTVVEVLAAFIREHARNRPAEPGHHEERKTAEWQGQPLSTDVQAALTVLGRRPSRPEPRQIDLSKADLRRADLTGLRFTGAQFFRTDLRGAHLDRADLSGANLLQARLGSAWMRDTILQDAVIADVSMEYALMTRAQLQRANLGASGLVRARMAGVSFAAANLAGADLAGADLAGADLTSARLHGAKLREVKGLTEEQLTAASINYETELPVQLEHLRPSE